MGHTKHAATAADEVACCDAQIWNDVNAHNAQQDRSVPAAVIMHHHHFALKPRGIFVDASFRRICRAIITESEGSSHAGGITALFIDAARAARATLPAIKIKQPPCIAVR